MLARADASLALSESSLPPGEKLRAALPITQLIFEVLNSFRRRDSFSVYGSPGFYPNK